MVFSVFSVPSVLKSVPVRIRECEMSDLAALHRMHAAQGFGYPLPDLEARSFYRNSSSKMTAKTSSREGK